MDLDSKTSGWDAIIGVEQMWEMLKQTVVEICGSVMVEERIQKVSGGMRSLELQQKGESLL